jgi:hypothetical protein
MEIGESTAAPDGSSDPSDDDENIWLELTLVDDRDQAVADARYEVTAPDGSQRSGRLDGQGFARLEGLPALGNYELRWPELEPWVTR